MTMPHGRGTAPSGDPMQLVWFHHAGGHGDSYRAMAAHLPSDWHVHLIEYPGRGALAHLPAHHNLAQLAAWLLPQITSLTQQPFAFFGHSMGALVAHEVARQMHEGQWPLPVWIGASGHRAPQLIRPLSEQLHGLPDDALVDRLRRMGALPAHAITGDYLRLMRTDLRACETRSTPCVSATSALPCALSTFTGDADPMVEAQDMHPWSHQVSGRVRHHVLPGGHFFLAGVKRRQVLDLIVRDIEEAQLATTTFNTPFFAHATSTSSSHHARLGHRHLEDVDRR